MSAIKRGVTKILILPINEKNVANHRTYLAWFTACVFDNTKKKLS